MNRRFALAPRWLPLAAISVAATVAFALTGCQKSSPAASPAEKNEKTDTAPEAKDSGPPKAGEKGEKTARVVRVTVAPITLRPIQRNVEVVGTFQGFEELTVSPQVGGRAIKVHADMGDQVKTGDLLLEIDPTDYRLAVDEARKGLASELAKIGLAALPQGELEVDKLPSVIRATNIESNWQRKMQRAEGLWRGKALAQEEYEQVQTEYRVAQASRQQVILDAEATLATARLKHAQLATALQRLAYTRVEVPASTAAAPGKKTNYLVAGRMVEEGEMVVSISPLAPQGAYRLVATEVLKLIATVPERYVSGVKKKQEVEVRVEAYPDKVFHGAVVRVNPTVDRTSRTFQIEVHVPNPENLLKPGGFAKLAILTHVDPAAPTVPIESLVSFAGVNKVFVVRPGGKSALEAHAVEVSPGVSGPKERIAWIEVRGKLDPQSQVITSGHTQLAEGIAVEVQEGAGP